MEPEFWHERWRENQIGFHQPQVHWLLERYLPKLELHKGAEVFVPLCGKSLDLLRLRDTGAAVLGVELSAIAVRAFFREHGLRAEEQADGDFLTVAAPGIRLLAGDFFALTPQHLAGVTAVYDRAALIALPPAQRRRYAHHMASLLAPSTQVLLITHDYAQARMSGPPFSVPEDEVRSLFEGHFSVTLLERQEVLERYPHFRARALDALYEGAYLLVRNAT